MGLTAEAESSPSGHSANAVSAFGALAARGRRRWLTAAAVIVPLLVGCVRYALVTFTDFGVYPMLFARVEGRWTARKAA